MSKEDLLTKDEREWLENIRNTITDKEDCKVYGLLGLLDRIAPIPKIGVPFHIALSDMHLFPTNMPNTAIYHSDCEKITFAVHNGELSYWNENRKVWSVVNKLYHEDLTSLWYKV